MTAEIYDFRTRRRISPPAEPQPVLSEAARYYCWEQLRHHERHVNMYRKILGLKAIERAVRGDET